MHHSALKVLRADQLQIEFELYSGSYCILLSWKGFKMTSISRSAVNNFQKARYIGRSTASTFRPQVSTSVVSGGRASSESLMGSSESPPFMAMANHQLAEAARTAPEPSEIVNQPSLVVFSGGTAFNSVAGSLRALTTQCAHVLPVSDDGGSTAEIVRVLGGPAVGDIRSRCLRLADDSDSEAEAVRSLLAHRLTHSNPEDAKYEWYAIVEGDSPLWEGVSEPYKHTIRAFLVHFHVNILRHSTERFDFSGGSVGNFFFAGARTFFRSLEAAIFLFSRVARIPEGSLVLPAICTEERLTLAAELADGTVICGQNEISHPGSVSTPCEYLKKHEESLQAPIRRVFYLSSEGDRTEHEVSPQPNPRVLSQIAHSDAIVYGMGSLYTSIAPSLVLQGMGEAIAARSDDCPKILILNGAIDREMSLCQYHPGPMSAADVVRSITDALNRKYATRGRQLSNAPAAYISMIVVPKGVRCLCRERIWPNWGLQK